MQLSPGQHSALLTQHSPAVWHVAAEAGVGATTEMTTGRSAERAPVSPSAFAASRLETTAKGRPREGSMSRARDSRCSARSTKRASVLLPTRFASLRAAWST